MEDLKYPKLQYPSPNMVRHTWTDLNGEWNFAFDDHNEGLAGKAWDHEEFFDRKIQVPYTYQWENSGIHNKEDHPIVWYNRTFELEHPGKTVLLHFGAVD